MPLHTHSSAAIDDPRGIVLNQMICSKPSVASAGESFYEAPGCHHVRSENTIKTEDAQFSAVMIVDYEILKNGYELLVVLDAEKEQEKQAEVEAGLR